MIHWLHKDCGWLRGCERDLFSQFGEDGLVDAILGRIGETCRVAFECGAGDGVFLSNTARLASRGWHSYLVERDPILAAQCTNNRSRETVRKDTIGPCGRPLDDVLSDMGCPPDMDLMVIDIDGQDYWVVYDMQARPRVLMVEYECPNLDSPPPERGDTACHQAGSTAIHELLDSKGYEVVVRTDCNAIAVRKELFALLTDGNQT